MVIPMIPAVKIGAKAPAFKLKCSNNAGAVKATACVSKPSNNAIAKQSNMTRH